MGNYDFGVLKWYTNMAAASTFTVKMSNVRSPITL